MVWGRVYDNPALGGLYFGRTRPYRHSWGWGGLVPGRVYDNSALGGFYFGFTRPYRHSWGWGWGGFIDKQSIAVGGESGYNLCQISAEVAVWVGVGTGIGVCGEG